jgi:HK97 gp10 family phage protein
MMDVRIENDNIPAVIRTLEAEQARASEQVAEHIKKRAERNAPLRTGHLRRRIRLEKFGHGETVDVVSDTGDATHREYAAYNEFGTRYMSARPYMTPAAVEGILFLPAMGVSMGARIELSAATGRAI